MRRPFGGTRHPRLWTALTVTGVLVAGAATAGAVALRHLDGNIRSVDVSAGLGNDRPAAEPTGSTGDRPLNILVVGSDTRAGANDFIGGGEKGEGRSDTTLVLHVAADRKSALGVSIPRDSMVRMPDCTDLRGGTVSGATRQFNEAYTIGGVACTQRTVEQLTGIRIDHYVIVDFAGFRQIVDALGSVEICLPRAVNDPLSKLDLPAGRQRVNGTEALAYVRTRHGLGDGGDLGRVARQQTFIAAVLQEATSAGTLANPKKLYDVLDTATRAITVDPGLASLTELASLARLVQGIGLENISFVTVPTAEYAPDPNRLEWSSEATRLWRAVRKDRPVVTTPSATASPEATASPDPTASPEATATGAPATTPGASASPGASATPSDGPVHLSGVTERRADSDICAEDTGDG
jgi:LCP family protein required for cell wall assembly